MGISDYAYLGLWYYIKRLIGPHDQGKSISTSHPIAGVVILTLSSDLVYN
jgi:hypothetical protein